MRIFIKVLIVALLTCSQIVVAQPQQPTTDHTVKDVVIIGAGISGLYTAYRLLNDPTYQNQSIDIYEMTDRVGGRIWTVRAPETPNIPVELGAMRFLKSQALIYNLTTKVLNLQVSDFGFKDKLHYTRGHQFFQEDYQLPDSYPTKIPYFLQDDEKNKTPGQLISHALEKVFPDSDKILNEDQLTQQLQQTTFQGIPLHEWSFANLLNQTLSHEALDLVNDLYGFYFISRVNAYNFILNLKLGGFSDTTYLKVDKGIQAVPDGLAQYIKEKNGKIHLEHQLYAIKWNEDTVSAKIGPTGDPSQATWIEAKHLVLAMPPAAIKKLADHSLQLQAPEFLSNLDSVRPLPLSKLFFVFETPWWHDRNPVLDFGRSTTDLPLQQIFYVGKDEETGRGLMLASYSDGHAVEYWEDFINPNDDRHHWGTPPTTTINSALKQLALVHQSEIPQPLNSIYVSWTAAAHFWNPYIKSWEVMPQLAHPFDNVNLYIVGEAFSREQGWMQSALETSEHVLETYFDLPPPAWLPQK